MQLFSPNVSYFNSTSIYHGLYLVSISQRFMLYTAGCKVYGEEQLVRNME